MNTKTRVLFIAAIAVVVAFGIMVITPSSGAIADEVEKSGQASARHYKGISLEVPSGWRECPYEEPLPFVVGADVVAYKPEDSSDAMLVLSGDEREGSVDYNVSEVRYALGRADLRMNGSRDWTYLQKSDVDPLRYIRDYPACRVGFEAKGPDDRVYSVECVGVSAPGNLIYVTALCSKDANANLRASLKAAMESIWPSSEPDDTAESFERLRYGARYTLPTGFVEKRDSELSTDKGCSEVEYAPSYGGGITVSIQNAEFSGSKGDKPATVEEVLNELTSRMDGLQNTVGSKGEDGSEFLRNVDEGEVAVAGVRSLKAVYEYADQNGDVLRASQVAMAFEGRAIILKVVGPAEAADYCGAMFEELVDSIELVDDPGDGYEVEQYDNDVVDVGKRRVFSGIARVRESGFGSGVAYLEMPGAILVRDSSNTTKQNFMLMIDGDAADNGFIQAFRVHEGERVAVVGSLANAKTMEPIYGDYQITGARLVGAASSAPAGDERATRREVAIGFATDMLARGELRDGELIYKDHDAFRKYVDPSSELYEYGDDEAEPEVLFQGGSMDIAADATIADEVGNTFFVDVDCRTYLGEESALVQHVTELAVVLNDDGLVQEAYYN